MHDKHRHTKNNSFEYIKFAAVIASITLLAIVSWNLSELSLLDSFMGMFFVVFASFKFMQLSVFARGFQNYDLLASRSLLYAYAYPFLQAGAGLLYLSGLGSVWLDTIVIIVSLISGAGVLLSLASKRSVHCVCLGNVIKLPLSRISLVEDFGMAIMASIMLFLR